MTQIRIIVPVSANDKNRIAELERQNAAMLNTLKEIRGWTPGGSQSRALIDAMLAASADKTAATVQPVAPSAREQELMQVLQGVYDAFGTGELARTPSTLMTCLRNVISFSEMLHAIEREFFMIPGDPDEDYPDEEPQPECLVNCWGSTVPEYVEQFRAALALKAQAIAAPQPQAAQSEDSRDAAILRAERDRARAMYDSAIRILTGIHALLYPPTVKADDGKAYSFRSPHLREQMQALSDRIRAIPDEIAALAQAGKEPK